MGSREEAASSSVVEGMGRGGGGFHRLWNPPRPIHFLCVPMDIFLGRRQWLSSSGPQPAEGTAGVGKSDAGIEQGGIVCPDLGPDIHGGGSVGPVVQVRYVGEYATHWEGVGHISSQGGPQADRESTSER